MIVLAVVGTMIGLTQPTILGFAVRAAQEKVILGVVLVINTLWRRTHPIAAFWTIMFGAFGGLCWFFAGSPFGIEPLWPGLGVGLLTLAITSLIKKPSRFRGLAAIE
jgi:hypothetical protein